MRPLPVECGTCYRWRPASRSCSHPLVNLGELEAGDGSDCPLWTRAPVWRRLDELMAPDPYRPPTREEARAAVLELAASVGADEEAHGPEEPARSLVDLSQWVELHYGHWPPGGGRRR